MNHPEIGEESADAPSIAVKALGTKAENGTDSERDDHSSSLLTSLKPEGKPLPTLQPVPLAKGGNTMKGGSDDGSQHSQDDEEDEEEEDDDDPGVPVEGAYDPSDYEHLSVSSEVKELFQYIIRYMPQTIELEHKLKPFIPDFIPAVGDIDAFLKVPRPDNLPDKLGLQFVDEPCANQSDPTVLDLQLRAISKQTTTKATVVKSLDNADKRPKEIESWIKSIENLHRSKPPPTVHYSRNMPDIESLMQEWPPEFEELLKEVALPSADVDCSLKEYADTVCGVLDVPVYKFKVQSLHVLFTLYSEFKNSQHFKALAMENKLDNSLKQPSGPTNVESDHLEL